MCKHLFVEWDDKQYCDLESDGVQVKCFGTIERCSNGRYEGE